MLENFEINDNKTLNNEYMEHDNKAMAYQLGGLSNTHLTTPYNVPNNVCIDYLKMRIDSSFSPCLKRFKKLLDTLRVDSKVYDDDVKVANYEKTYIFDANVFIMTGGQTTRNVDGVDTTIIELKGQACREFEGRGGNWKELFEALFELGAICKRIDIALDDFQNTCPINSLIYKVNHKLYISDWKNAPEVRYSAKGGFSMTFGKYSSKTLCIYNKLAEREQKGIDVYCKDWLRYEARFKDETGDGAFMNVYTALSNNTLDKCAKELIKGLIEFKKDKNGEDKNHLYRADNREKWNVLLNVDSRIKIRNQYKLESTITSKIKWLGHAATKNRMILELVNPDLFTDVDGYFVYDHIKKLKNREIASLNYSRINFGLNKISLDEAKDYLTEKYSDYANPSEEVYEMLGKITKDGEIKD